MALGADDLRLDELADLQRTGGLLRRQQVHDAIVGNKFWILTHADMRELPVERMRRAATGENPTLG